MAQSELLSRERTDEVSSCFSSLSGRKEERRPRHEAASSLCVCVGWGGGGAESTSEMIDGHINVHDVHV